MLAGWCKMHGPFQQQAFLQSDAYTKKCYSILLLRNFIILELLFWKYYEYQYRININSTKVHIYLDIHIWIVDENKIGQHCCLLSYSHTMHKNFLSRED